MVLRFRGNFTYWSILSIVIAIPIWIFVIYGSVMDRQYDGGIFLSISDGLANGLNRYTDLWDNKDPFFAVAMAGASHISSPWAFFMDLFWIPLAAVGTFFISRSIASPDRSLFFALVTTPFIMVGPAYMAGHGNTPGTAMVLFGWGMFLCRRWVLGGIAIGLLLFLKITVWPVGVAGLLLFLFFRDKRSGGVRALVAMGVTFVVSVTVMAILGWIPGYIESISQNRSYSKTTIAYFGFSDSFSGHLEKLQADWAGSIFVAFLVMVSIAVVGLLFSSMKRRTHPEVFLVTVLLWIAIFGTIASLALTYLWGHHLQAISLPMILAAILFGSLLNVRIWFILWVGLLLILTFILSMWMSPIQLFDHYKSLPAVFDSRVTEISEVPIDANLLNSIPLKDFSYARLGTNDDRGFLGSVREGAVLVCPRFQVFDFSPTEAFAELYECIQRVDVILKTENFNIFGNGMNAANVQPILDYVNANFDCLIVSDRQLCTRR